jgi:F-type H+-transporting ATPase subunit delta
VAVAHRIYAEALFEAAKERGRLGEVHEELGEFVRALDEVPELRDVLRNPQLDPRAKRDILDEVTRDADELVRNFLRLVADKGRAGELEEIQRELDRLVAREQRHVNVELTTAVELSDEELGSIVSQIESASGRTVDATTNVDPDLIGGVVLQVGTRRMDASVRGRLERLRRDLVRSA